MGKVRTSLVKRTARELLEAYPDLFTDNFETNKKLVSSLAEWKSKKLRNQVAGYITSLVKQRLANLKREEAQGTE